MEEMDPAKKQYLIFSAIISLFIALFINFIGVELAKGSPLYGFPMKLEDVSTVVSIIYRLINSVVFALFTLPLVYYGITWLQNKAGGIS